MPIKKLYNKQLVLLKPTSDFVTYYLGKKVAKPLLAVHKSNYSFRLIVDGQLFFPGVSDIESIEPYIIEGECKCGKKANKKQSLIKLGSDFYCADCIPKIEACYRCDAFTAKTYTALQKNKEVKLCERCFSGASTCRECNKRFLPRLSPSDMCGLCSSIYTAFNGQLVKKDALFVCRWCGNKDLLTRKNRHAACAFSHSTLPERVDTEIIRGTTPGKYLVHDRAVGFELEVVPPKDMPCSEAERRVEALRRLPFKELAVVYDGSVRCYSDDLSMGSYIYGKEIVLPPRSLDLAETLLTEVCTELKSRLMTVNDSCGLHVHFEAAAIKDNPVKLSHLFRTLFAVEDILFSLQPRSRWNNSYCVPLSSNHSFEDFARPISMHQFESSWYRSDDNDYIYHSKNVKRDPSKTRYCGVNLHSAFYRGTIEFRHHAGSLNAEKILGWTGLLSHIIDYASNRYDDSQVVDLYRMATNKEKVKLMFTYLDIPESIRSYVLERMSKWNQKFVRFKTSFESKSRRQRFFTKSKFEARRVEIKQRKERERFDTWVRLATSDFNQKVFERCSKKSGSVEEIQDPGDFFSSEMRVRVSDLINTRSNMLVSRRIGSDTFFFNDGISEEEGS